MRRGSVLVVDDDPDFASGVETTLVDEGWRAAQAQTVEAALGALSRERFDIVLADMRMPGKGGLDLLRTVRRSYPSVEVVIVTGSGSIESSVEAMKAGAADYLQKPFKAEALLRKVDQVYRLRFLEREVARLQGELVDRFSSRSIVGASAAMQRVFERITGAAQASSSVLISGESGTGKELVARAIHFEGVRSRGPFKPINCAALPREIIESELFGHVRGAFTSALADHEGLFRAAQGGTLFLDEIGEMPIETQAKLLRCLEEGKIRPVGSTAEVAVDCRIIAATNRDPHRAIAEGRLREDLYYRLAVIPIELPPLRERRDDVPLLVASFVAQFNERFQKSVRAFEPEALERLVTFAWPGNVRELRNVVEGAVALARSPDIPLAELPAKLQPRPHPDRAAPATSAEAAAAACGAGDELPPVEETVREIERTLLLRSLRVMKGNKTRAAQALKVSRKWIYRKLEEFGIEDPGPSYDEE